MASSHHRPSLAHERQGPSGVAFGQWHSLPKGTQGAKRPRLYLKERPRSPLIDHPCVHNPSSPRPLPNCIIAMMIEFTIPGRGPLRLEHLVTDVNGTLALDGVLIDGVAQRISALRDRLTVHLLTADTHGRQAVIDQQLNPKGERLTPGNEQDQKQAYVSSLGAASVVAIGQGANDALMLKAAGLDR